MRQDIDNQSDEIDDHAVARVAFHNMAVMLVAAVLALGVGTATVEVGGGILIVVGAICAFVAFLYGIRWAVRGT